MAIYNNSTGTWPPRAPGVALTEPLVRPVPFKLGSGRTYTAGRSLVRVTPLGHWYAEEDAACRGCGTTLVGPAAGLDRTDEVLDLGGRCPHPASHQDVASALLGRSAVAA